MNDEEKCDILYSTIYHATSQKHILSNKMNVNNNNQINVKMNPIIHSITNRKGIIFYYAKINKGHFGIPKVIVCLTKNISNPINDYKGEFGMTQYSIGIKIKNKNEGDQIIKYLLSPEFFEIYDACRWYNSSDVLDPKFFKNLKKQFYIN